MKRTGITTAFAAALLFCLVASGHAQSSCCSDCNGNEAQCTQALGPYGLAGYCTQVTSDTTMVNKGCAYSALTALATAPALSALDMDTMAQQVMGSKGDPAAVACMCTFKQITLLGQPATAPIIKDLMNLCTTCSSLGSSTTRGNCGCCMQYTFDPTDPTSKIKMAACNLATTLLGTNFCNFASLVPKFAPLVCSTTSA